MAIHGYPWISMDISIFMEIMDIHGCLWISWDIHGYPLISMDIWDIYGKP